MPCCWRPKRAVQYACRCCRARARKLQQSAHICECACASRARAAYGPCVPAYGSACGWPVFLCVCAACTGPWGSGCGEMQCLGPCLCREMLHFRSHPPTTSTAQKMRALPACCWGVSESFGVILGVLDTYRHCTCGQYHWFCVIASPLIIHIPPE